MGKYIPLDAVVAEIERNKKIFLESEQYNKDNKLQNTQCLYHRLIGFCEEILTHINTLEVKEVDLDYIKDELDKVVKFYKPDGDFGWGTLYNVATHFFELGLKAQKGEKV